MSFGGMAFLDFAKESLFRITDNEMMEEDRNQRQMYEAGQAQINRDFQQRNMDTTYQRAVTDLKGAGLNPMLAFQHPAPASASGAQGSGAGGSTSRAAFSSVASAAQANESVHRAELIDAEADKVRAEEKEIIARTPTHGVSIEKMQQEIAESEKRAEKYVAEASQAYASAGKLRQEEVNLKEMVPHIRSSITLMRAQTQERLQAAGLNEAQAKEVRQRIEANLPRMQKALAELEAKLKDLQLPGAQSKALRDDSLIGIMAEYAKAIADIRKALMPF